MLYQWIYIDFNSYFASVEQQLDPALRGKPVAVVPMETDSTCAIAASYEAKAYGIKTGTKIFEAKQKCPELICVLANHEKYVTYHHKFLEEIDKHIQVHTVHSIDECACELQGKEQTAEGAKKLSDKIKQGIHKNIGEAINCSVGISTNSFLAKVASNLDKPDGFTILHPDDFCTRLSNKPLNFLPGIGNNMLRRFYENEVYTIADFYKLSPKQMRKIWHSVGGERYWHLIRGFHIPMQETKRSTIGHSHVLDPKNRPVFQAKDVARRLTMKAASRLRRLGYHASEIHLSIRIENGDRVQVKKNFYRARDSFTISKELSILWGYLIVKYKPKRIKKISISLYGLIEDDKIQPDLLDSINKAKLEKVRKLETVSNAMDKLNSRFGRDTIVLGDIPKKSHNFSGTKVAFTRIPEFDEFHE